MSSLNGFMRPIASRNATPDHVETLRQNILGASLPSSLRAKLNKMSPEHRTQIETLAKLLHQSALALGKPYSQVAKSMWPNLSYERRDMILGWLEAAVPQAEAPNQVNNSTSPIERITLNSIHNEWVQALGITFDEPRRGAERGATGSSQSFMDKLIQSESSSSQGASYTTQDVRSFVGYLQFGEARLNDYKAATGAEFTQDEFINDSELQSRVAAWHIADIDAAIDGMGEFAQRFNRDGLRAAAHLGGITGMKRFVLSDGQYNPSDELGTSLRDYYDRFRGGPNVKPFISFASTRSTL